MVCDYQQHTSTTSTNLTAVRASAHVHVCLMFGIHRGRHKASERERVKEIQQVNKVKVWCRSKTRAADSELVWRDTFHLLRTGVVEEKVGREKMMSLGEGWSGTADGTSCWSRRRNA